ncbi:MAG: hypothetical protein ACSLFR_13010 [Solirubrobacteraceae bacterium]
MALGGVKVGTAYIEIKGDWDGFNKSLDRQTRPLGEKLKKVGKVAGAALAARRYRRRGPQERRPRDPVVARRARRGPALVSRGRGAEGVGGMTEVTIRRFEVPQTPAQARHVDRIVHLVRSGKAVRQPVMLGEAVKAFGAAAANPALDEVLDQLRAQGVDVRLEAE